MCKQKYAYKHQHINGKQVNKITATGTTGINVNNDVNKDFYIYRDFEKAKLRTFIRLFTLQATELVKFSPSCVKIQRSVEQLCSN